MTIMFCLITATVVWGLMLAWAKRQVSLTVEALDTEIRFWQTQTEIAKADLARLAREATLREEAWRQGRDAMLAILRQLRVSPLRGDSPLGPEQHAA
jgi:hypothetical protein